jgi:hypothetical protein
MPAQARHEAEPLKGHMSKQKKELEIEITALNTRIVSRAIDASRKPWQPIKFCIRTHFENEGHVVEAYTTQGTFTLGYNLKLKEAAMIVRAVNVLTAALEKP